MSKNVFFEDLFHIFNGTLKYSIMNGYENYPQDIGSDIDICVESITQFEQILRNTSIDLDFKLIQRLEHHHKCVNYFIAKKYENEWVILSLDVYTHYIHKGNVLFNSDWFLNERLKFKFFYISKPENEFNYYLVKKIIKQDIDKHIDSILNQFAHLDIDLDLSRFFPQSHKIIKKSLKTTQKDYFLKNKQKLKAELESNLKINTLGNLNELYRRFKRVFSPTGLIISFLGPDGSGKSTIIDALCKNELPFRRTDYFHLKPRVIGPKGDGKPVPNPHGRKAYPGLLSYLKLFHFIIDYWLGYPKILKNKIQSSLVIFDRYYDDFYIDPKRFRYGGNIRFAKLMGWFVPKPDITFVLIAPPKVIYERKQEVEFNDLKRQIEEYKDLEAKDCVLINVNQSVEKIIEDINSHMYKKLNERY